MQSNNADLQQLITLTGFDPTRDVNEVLAATNSTTSKSPNGLVLARGTFNVSMITAAATANGALTEVYNNVTILESPQKMAGIAFLTPTLAMAGDIANVKAAIDRPGTGQSLPSNVLTQVNQWSGNEDAWVVTTAPLSSLTPSAPSSTDTPANPMGSVMAGVMQQIQQISGGVKFGNNVVGTAAIQADNANDATQLANTVQFFVNLMQMQSQKNSQLSSLAQGLTVNAQGTTVNVTITLPEAQFQQLFQMQKKAAATTGK
jgi:hypothetical protein